MYGHVSHEAEPNSTPELSPVATNDDSQECAGFVSNRTNEEVDDDDPFSKRRYNFSQSSRFSAAYVLTY